MQPRELELAAWLAREGFLTVVPCWANLGGVRPVNLGCVADARLVASESAMLKDIRTYSEAARTLPNARADRLVLMGHSLGAWAAVLAASTGVPVDAVVSISGTYNGEQRALSELGVLIKENLDGLRSPLLIVHGTKDDVWVIGPAREYEQLALTRGKKVEALYVEGAPHGLPYRPEFWTDEVRGRVIAFLRK
jgi:dienelactone hydrolase